LLFREKERESESERKRKRDRIFTARSDPLTFSSFFSTFPQQTNKQTNKRQSSKSRFFLAAAAAATAFAVGHLAGSWPINGGSGIMSTFSDPRICDVRVGCTPAQLAAKRKTPKAAGRRHAFASVQQAWGFDAPGSKGIDLIDVVDRLIGEDKLKCVVNLGE
jgi:hypothetical protein